MNVQNYSVNYEEKGERLYEQTVTYQYNYLMPNKLLFMK